MKKSLILKFLHISLKGTQFFLRKNIFRIYLSRFTWFTEQFNETEFVDYDDWATTGVSDIQKQKIECKKNDCETILLKIKFYLSKQKVYHTYNIESWVTFLADIGGLSKAYFTIFGLLGFYINHIFNF